MARRRKGGPSANPPSKGGGKRGGTGGGGSSTAPAKPAPIGVPKGYRAKNPDGTPVTRYVPGKAQFTKGRHGPGAYVPGSGLGAPKLYREGDQFSIANWPMGDIADLQTRLARLGLIDPDKVRWGTADEETLGGLSTLMGYANQAGTEWEDELEYRTQVADSLGDDGGSGSGSERAPFQASLTNEADIRAKLDRDTPDLIGHSLSEAEKAGIVGEFHGLEESTQRAAYDANISGGTTTEAPSLEAFTIEKMKRERGSEVAATQIGENARKLMDTFANGSY